MEDNERYLAGALPYSTSHQVVSRGYTGDVMGALPSRSTGEPGQGKIQVIDYTAEIKKGPLAGAPGWIFT